MHYHFTKCTLNFFLSLNIYQSSTFSMSKYDWGLMLTIEIDSTHGIPRFTVDQIEPNIQLEKEIWIEYLPNFALIHLQDLVYIRESAKNYCFRSFKGSPHLFCFFIFWLLICNLVILSSPPILPAYVFQSAIFFLVSLFYKM